MSVTLKEFQDHVVDSVIELLIDKNIRYLNIKPEYILILEKNIKLVDYGLTFLNNEIINNYMSPELFKN